MQKFKVGDKVKVLNIPGLDSSDYPEIVGNVFEVIQACPDRNSYRVGSNQDYFSYYAIDLELVNEKSASEKINGHIWLIANKQTGKVIEGYQTRKEARENRRFMYDNPSDFKIVKYTFN